MGKKRILLAVLVLVFAAVAARIVQRTTEPWQRAGFYRAVEQALLAPLRRPSSLGDGGPATELLLCDPMGLVLARDGSLLVSDRGRGRRGRVVWRIDADGIAHVVVGSGLRGDATQDRALELRLDRPESMALMRDGSLLLSDGFNHVVLRIHPDGRVERFAGTGEAGYSGDGGPAAEARLDRPAAIALDRSESLYIADVKNHSVRRVDPSGTIRTVAGTGAPGFSPDGTPAIEASLDTPWGLGLDLEDRLLIGDGANHRVLRREADGRLVTVVGSGRPGFAGDGGPATEARVNFPEALFHAPDGRLFFGDEWNHAVRVVEPGGGIETVMGLGFPGRASLGGVAKRSPLDDPESVLWTSEGLLVTDSNNGRVIRIDRNGLVHLVAGRGEVQSCDSWW